MYISNIPERAKGVGMNGTRVTIRLSDVELDEIDDFLARHPEYRSRSELIRNALMTYIKMSDRGMFSESGMKLEIEDRILTVLEDYVDYKYFRDMGDLITYVLRVLVSNGELARILKAYTGGLSALRLNEKEKRVPLPRE